MQTAWKPYKPTLGKWAKNQTETLQSQQIKMIHRTEDTKCSRASLLHPSKYSLKVWIYWAVKVISLEHPRVKWRSQREGLSCISLTPPILYPSIFFSQG
jgi:hypothetical protein